MRLSKACGGGSCRPAWPSREVGMALALINFGIDEFVNPRLRTAGLGTKKSARLLREEARPYQTNLRSRPSEPKRGPSAVGRLPGAASGGNDGAKPDSIDAKEQR